MEVVDWDGIGAETVRRRSRRAAVARPYGLSVLVDGNAIRAAQGPLLDAELCPIADDPIGIGAAIDRFDIPRLRRARRLGLETLCCRPHDNHGSKPTSRES